MVGFSPWRVAFDLDSFMLGFSFSRCITVLVGNNVLSDFSALDNKSLKSLEIVKIRIIVCKMHCLLLQVIGVWTCPLELCLGECCSVLVTSRNKIDIPDIVDFVQRKVTSNKSGFYHCRTLFEILKVLTFLNLFFGHWVGLRCTGGTCFDIHLKAAWPFLG